MYWATDVKSFGKCRPWSACPQTGGRWDLSSTRDSRVGVCPGRVQQSARAERSTWSERDAGGDFDDSCHGGDGSFRTWSCVAIYCSMFYHGLSLSCWSCCFPSWWVESPIPYTHLQHHKTPRALGNVSSRSPAAESAAIHTATAGRIATTVHGGVTRLKEVGHSCECRWSDSGFEF